MTTKQLNTIFEPFWEANFSRAVEFNDGWNELVYELHNKIITIDPNYKIAQAKEKFGGLRFHFLSSNREEVFKLVHEAESKSFTICEDCGKEPAKSYAIKKWLRTLCKDCVSKIPSENIEQDYDKYKPIILG